VTPASCEDPVRFSGSGDCPVTLLVRCFPGAETKQLADPNRERSRHRAAPGQDRTKWTCSVIPRARWGQYQQDDTASGATDGDCALGWARSVAPCNISGLSNFPAQLDSRRYQGRSAW